MTIPQDIRPMGMEEFKAALPINMRKLVSDELLDTINNTIANPEILDIFRENVLGYTSVLRHGRFKMENYLNAVKFISYKLLGDSNRTAWAKTFPDRFARMKRNGTSESDIASVTSSYNKSKLVILIYEQTLIPTHIINAPLFQAAINVQAELMVHAKSEKVRCDAAANLIMNLKPPETQKIELDIGVKEDESIKMLRESTMDLARQQQNMIKVGAASVAGIASSKLITSTVIEEGTINE